MTDRLPPIQAIGGLELGPADALVVMAPARLGTDSRRALRDYVRHHLGGTDRPILILDGGMQIGVLREDDSPAAAHLPEPEVSDSSFGEFDAAVRKFGDRS